MANNKKYKVKKGNVGGFGGRMFEIGDTVSESDFPNGNAKELSILKVLEEIKPKKETAKEKKDREKLEAIEVAKTELNDSELELKDAEDALENAEKEEIENAEKALELAKIKFEEKTKVLADLQK